MGFFNTLLARISGRAIEPLAEKKTPDLTMVKDLEEWASVRRQPVALLFKHSPICHISTTARRQVVKFSVTHPEIPVYSVDVLNHRDVSLTVARDLDIAHQSPQAILLVGGKPRWHDSQWAVRASAIEDALPDS